MTRRFANFVDRSLCGILHDRPRSYRHFCADMSGLAIVFDVGGERVSLSFNHAGHLLHETCAAPQARIATTHEAIIALARGDADLISALMAERVALFGSTKNLCRFHEALLRFVNLMLKSPSAQREFSEYQRPHGST